MQQSVCVLDQQHLVQTTAELCKLQAEIQQLKDLIRAAEAKPGPQCAKVTIAFAGQASPS